MSGKAVVFECIGGASGNMLLGAFLDLGLELKALKEALFGLGLDGFEIEVKKETKLGIQGSFLDVVPRSSSMGEKTYAQIRDFLDNLPSGLHVDLARQAFKTIADAEARVHGILPEEVHFHELGAVDALVDILGNAFALQALDIEEAYCAEVPVGRGLVSMEHGSYPAPAPATIEILKGFPIHWSDVAHEMVTPTGAALLKTFVKHPGRLPGRFILERVGYGLGTADFPDRPNLLRASLGTLPPECRAEGVLKDAVWELVFQVDDMTPEEIAWVLEEVMKAGALDVILTHGLMKKGRPGFRIEVMSDPLHKEGLVSWILKHTSSWGVRESLTSRSVLSRRETEVETSLGRVRLKASPGPIKKEKFAFEDIRRLSGALGLSPSEILDILRTERRA